MKRETVHQAKVGLIATHHIIEGVRPSYQVFFNLAPDCYIITDFQGVICEANLAAQAFLDMPQDLLLRKPIISLVTEGDQQEFHNQLAQLQTSLSALDDTTNYNIKPLEWKARLQPHDGRFFIANVSVRIIQNFEEKPECLVWSLHKICTYEQEVREIRNSLEVPEHQISNQEQVEEQLLKSKLKFQSIVEQSQDGIFLTDEKGLIVEWNPAEEEITGLSHTVVLGCPVWKIFQQMFVEDKSLKAFDQQALLLASLTTGQAPWMGKLVEKEIRRPKGTNRIIQMSFFLIQTALGFLLGGITHDITERKQLKLALQKNSNLLDNQSQFITRIMDSIPSSLVVIDRFLRIVSVNHNFLEKTRREEHATLGFKLDAVFPQALLDYTQIAQRVQEVFQTGRSVDGGKVAYRTPGLSSRVYYFRLFPIFVAPCLSSGKILDAEHVENVMLLMDDITEREELREEMRLIERHLAGVVEGANDLVVSLDPQGNIVTWNRAAEMVSGMKSEQVKGHSFVSVCTTDHQLTMTNMLNLLIQSRSAQHTETNLQNPSNKKVAISWNCSLLFDDSHNLAGIVAVGRDLTESRHMEEKLSQSAAMASLGVMAGGIAHDLRNPLGIIWASAQLLMENLKDSKLRTQCLQNIDVATRRASLIIENLLKFARPAGGWEKKEINLHAIFDETLTLLANEIAVRKITVTVTYQAVLPQLFGSHQMLQQVFTNLILNACNAMPEGGLLRITIETISVDQVEIHFVDTGCGIPPENLGKIFDPFFTTMPVGKGVGLGLSISHTIIQQHQGVIDVQSEVGKGSDFTVRLPAIL